jgi:hypothetical protein
MAQGLTQYRAGSKRNWRGWQWNRIVERLAVPPEDATVLYLCGPEDLDRAKALEKGFRTENLIAVDVVEENVRRVRAGGGLAICHDLHELILNWPTDWPIHGIVADYCGGLSGTTLPLRAALMFSPATYGAIVSANFLRGHDAASNEIRAKWDTVADDDLRGHRGFSFAMECFFEGTLCHCPPGPLPDLGETYWPHTEAAFNSYTSTGWTYFDTVVFRWLGVFPHPHGRREMWADPEWLKRTLRPWAKAARVRPASRKIAACRAVRTAKLRAAA